MTTGESVPDHALQTSYGTFGESDIQEIHRSLAKTVRDRTIYAALGFGNPSDEIILSRIKGCLTISEIMAELECIFDEKLRESALERLDQLVSMSLGQYSNACARLELLPILPRRSRAQRIVLEKAIADVSSTAGVLHVCKHQEIALFPDLEDKALKKAIHLSCSPSEIDYILEMLSPGDPLKFVAIRRLAELQHKSRK